MKPGLIRQLATDVLDLLYPPACLCCNAPPEQRQPLCEKCVSYLTLLPDPVCPQCRTFLTDLSCLCPNGHIQQPALLWALGLFDDYYQVLIHAYKFGQRTDCGEFLARRLARKIAGDVRSRQIEAVIPVPLHPARRRERGFNQCTLLAECATTALGLEAPSFKLIRQANTKSQTRLSRSDRQQNVAQAFKCPPLHNPPGTVLLIDDVQTTGATLAACASVLQDAGVSRVYGAVVALAELTG